MQKEIVINLENYIEVNMYILECGMSSGLGWGRVIIPFVVQFLVKVIKIYLFSSFGENITKIFVRIFF